MPAELRPPSFVCACEKATTAGGAATMLQPLAMLLATSLSQIPDAPKKINLRAFLAGDKMQRLRHRPVLGGGQPSVQRVPSAGNHPGRW